MGTADESSLIAGLRAGDQGAFAVVVDRYTPSMLRVARSYVAGPQVAEDVVQETWIAVIKGIANFEGRSSLRTWLFAILVNTAKTRGIRDRRELDRQSRIGGPTVDPARFQDDGDARPGAWKEAPADLHDGPEGSALAREFTSLARRHVDALPGRQRAVVTLRDIIGLTSEEVCAVLKISAANQRVLLHRGRMTVRQALEGYVRDVPAEA